MARSRFGYELIMKFWKYGHCFDNWPLLSKKHSEKTTSGHILPVNQPVSAGKNMVLPMQVLGPMIERANGVAIMNECMCRRGQNCRAFPRRFGCLLLGSAVAAMNPALARIATPAEAISHAERGIRMGLVPLIIHNTVDAWMWGLDFRRMMNVCFCCECCCDVRIGIRNRVAGFYENIHRLPGLTVSVGDGCVGCGTCREICLAKAIELSDGRAKITDDCKGCGRCISMCPEGAITLSFDSRIDTVGVTLEHYERRADVGRLSARRAATY
jgi:UDP-glucose 4-epimerase